MNRLFIIVFLIPSCALAYAFDTTGDDEFSLQDQANQESEFLVPQAAVSTSPPLDYTIGPLDLLEIEVFRVDDLKRTVRVNSEGTISLPRVIVKSGV